MCPGLTSPGAKMIPVEKDSVVVSFSKFLIFILLWNDFQTNLLSKLEINCY